MSEIKVVIEIPDLTKAIAQLALAIQAGGAIGSGGNIIIPAGTAMRVDGVEATSAAVTEPVTPVPLEPVPVPPQQPIMNEPVPAPPAVIDLDAISRAGAALVDQGKMNDVLKVLQEKYGIYAVTQLRPDQYNTFADDLRALGANI